MRAKRTTLLRAAKAPTKGARRRPKTRAREAKGNAREAKGKMQSSTPSEFDAARLEGFLRARVNGAHGAYFHLERISGGQSNPTYFVTVGNRRLVMRKKPGGATLRSAHAIDREYRVLKALAATDVPVPRAVIYCDDDGIVGTPFYVMDRLDGRIFPDAALPDTPPAQREAMYLAM